MKEQDKKFFSLIARYLILILIAIPGMDVFYFFFLPLTKWPVFLALQGYAPFMVDNSIYIGHKIIEIVGACVAGSAYYFLLILNLSIPNIKIKKRLKMIGVAFLTFILINIIRIIILSFMYIEGSPIFDITHKIFWYLGSTLFVVGIWFFEIYRFKITGIPFVSDLKFMYRLSSLNRNRTKNKKRK